MTGRELLAALESHPERLDMEVRLLTHVEDHGAGHPLYAVDYDQFEDGAPDVLVLSALECDRPEPKGAM